MQLISDADIQLFGRYRQCEQELRQSDVRIAMAGVRAVASVEMSKRQRTGHCNHSGNSVKLKLFLRSQYPHEALAKPSLEEIQG